LRGVTHPRLSIDRNGDGHGKEEEVVAEGLNDGEALRFTGLDIPLKAGDHLYLAVELTHDMFEGVHTSAAPVALAAPLALLALLVAARRRARAWGSLAVLAL